MKLPCRIDGSLEFEAFAQDRRGSVAIIFALTATIVVGMVGGAVDFGRAYSARERVQQTADAAVLAAARVWQLENDLEAAKARGMAFYLANKPKDLAAVTGDFAVDEVKNTMSLDVAVRIPTPFLSVVGTENVTANVHAQAQLAQGVTANRNLEVSIMLDVTGSMAGAKVAALKAAAHDLIDIVVWEEQGKFTSRIAMVPFAEAVRPGPYLQAVRGTRASTYRFQDNNGYFQRFSLTDCVSDRNGNEALTDAPPVGNDKAGPVYTRNGSCLPGSAIVPLTNEKTRLHTAIDGLTTGGNTAGQIGTEWAWYMLSPNWNGIWPSNAAAPYGSNVLKVAILMTDGEYNLAYDDAGVATRDSGKTASNGSPDGQARLLCDGMKAKGIAVYSIGFALKEPKAEETLRHCATDSSYVYMAEDGETLRLAFRDIAQRLATFHLSQ
ncbi:MAG: TadE/TadG family type IV pilus assembly protein [Hyphomicrobiaceae bacterium]